MLKIRIANSQQYFLTTGYSSVTADSGKIVHLCVAVGPFGPSGETFDFKGNISSGPPNRFGERQCHHSQWEGDITFMSGWVLKTDQHFPYYQYKDTSARVLAIIPPGGSYLSEPWTVGGVMNQFRVTAYGTNIVSYTYNARSTKNSGSANSYVGITALGSLTYYRSVRSIPYGYNNFLTMDFVAPPGTVYTRSGLFVSGVALTRAQLYDTLCQYKRYVLDSLEREFPTEPYFWGRLSQKAVENIAFSDVNGLQYFPELLLIKKTLGDITKINPRSAKSLASAYLAWKYGIESSFRDSTTYAKGFGRLLKRKRNGALPWRASRAVDHSVVSSSLGSLEIEYHYKIFYRYYNDAILNGYRVLREWGLAPTLSMSWDLIPFSFVVDWFVDVGSVIEQLDYAPMRAVYKILGVTKSEKRTLRLDPSAVFHDWPCVGDLSYKTYHRSTQRKADEPHFSYDSPQDFHNHVEATALILQRMK